MANMDTITAQVSKLQISPPHPYVEQFNRIAGYINKVRPGSPSDAELNVTTFLAGPFTSGGLLVILLEPLPTHPWREGPSSVVSKCPTLDALNEGLSIASHSRLNLIDDVSVLDIRPFTCKEQNSRLEDYQRQQLYNLVMRAINAKNPEVILCMGNEARFTLQSLWRQLSCELRKNVKMVYAMHPSYSVNHHCDDRTMRLKLLKSISSALESLDPLLVQPLLGNVILPDPKLGLEQFNPSDNPEDTTWVHILLWAVTELCLWPDYKIPGIRLMGPGYFRFEQWHEEYFDHLITMTTETLKDHFQQIAAKLVPFLRRFNRCLKSTSWYLYTHQVNWEGVKTVLREELTSLAYICELLSAELPMKAQSVPTREGNFEDLNDTLYRGQLMALRMAALVRKQPSKRRRDATWVRIIDD